MDEERISHVCEGLSKEEIKFQNQLNKNGGKKMDEERISHVCECEGCGYYPLSHLEKCPKCNSEAYHTRMNISNEEEIKNRGSFLIPYDQLFEDILSEMILRISK